MKKENKKIMIIEDDKFLLKAYKIKFDKAGFETMISSDGITGLELAKKEVPSIIILDMMLPKMNGFEFLKKIKSEEKLKDIPIIAVSNLGQEEDQKKALELGAEEYLIKTDYSLEQIIEKVKNIVV